MIYILTGNIRTGKTTALINWAADRTDVGGFVTPDSLNGRILKRLGREGLEPLEQDQPSTDVKIVKVGKFSFYQKAFDLGDQWIKEDLEDSRNKYIVIDEIGKLELQGKGWSKALRDILKHDWSDRNLILVVRESLLEEVQGRFDIHDASIVAKDWLTLDVRFTNELAAIVLAAGESRRLGKSKQLLKLDGQELLLRTVNKLLELNKRETGNTYEIPLGVVTGHQQAQIKKLLQARDCEFVHNPDYQEGMATSLLSGLDWAEKLPKNRAVLICLSDQPLISRSHYMTLINAHKANPEKIITTSYADTLGAPTVFPRRFYPLLRAKAGSTGAKKIIMDHIDEVISIRHEPAQYDVDTMEDLERVLNLWNIGKHGK